MVLLRLNPWIGLLPAVIVLSNYNSNIEPTLLLPSLIPVNAEPFITQNNDSEDLGIHLLSSFYMIDLLKCSLHPFNDLRELHMFRAMTFQWH